MDRERHPFAPSRRRLGALLAAGAAVVLPTLPVISGPAEPDAELIALVAEHNDHGAKLDDLDGPGDPEWARLAKLNWALRKRIVALRATTLRGLMAKASVSLPTAAVLAELEQDLRHSVETNGATLDLIEVSCAHDLAHLAHAAGLLRA